MIYDGSYPKVHSKKCKNIKKHCTIQKILEQTLLKNKNLLATELYL